MSYFYWLLWLWAEPETQAWSSNNSEDTVEISHQYSRVVQREARAPLVLVRWEVLVTCV